MNRYLTAAIIALCFTAGLYAQEQEKHTKLGIESYGNFSITTINSNSYMPNDIGNFGANLVYRINPQLNIKYGNSFGYKYGYYDAASEIFGYWVYSPPKTTL
jgi:hypothetical protein